MGPGEEKPGTVKAVGATGFALGQSFCVGNLVNFYESFYDFSTSRWKPGAPDAPYTRLIALALGMKEGERQKGSTSSRPLASLLQSCSSCPWTWAF